MINMRVYVGAAGTGGGRGWRFVCGLISPFLANPPSIIMAGVFTDLSCIFCMFGFYLIMFYSESLLCTFCSATVSTVAREKNTLQDGQTALLPFIISL